MSTQNAIFIIIFATSYGIQVHLVDLYFFFGDKNICMYVYAFYSLKVLNSPRSHPTLLSGGLNHLFRRINFSILGHGM